MAERVYGAFRDHKKAELIALLKAARVDADGWRDLHHERLNQVDALDVEVAELKKRLAEWEHFPKPLNPDKNADLENRHQADLKIIMQKNVEIGVKDRMIHLLQDTIVKIAQDR